MSKNLNFRDQIFYWVLMGFLFSVFFLAETGLFYSFGMRGGDIEKTGNIRVVMLGDSITFRGDWNSLLDRNDVGNKGIDGDTLSGIFKRLDSVVRLRPKICFVMGGINDISRGQSVEKIYQDYLRVLERLVKENIKPIVQSTLMVESSWFESGEINQKVNELNLKLKNFSRENNIDFLDLNQSMSRGGELISAYTVDGVHLSQKGYDAWKGILVTYLEKMDF